MAIVPKCGYCKYNEGEDIQFRFMWKCGLLGYCVPFRWHKCKAKEKGMGGFELESIVTIIEKK